jgi:hypothetical protein
MLNRLTNKERKHLARVKELPCSVCDAPGPSDAHHIKQGAQYTCVALCKVCHQDARLGWHGEKAIWRIKKMDELSALNITIERLLGS